MKEHYDFSKGVRGKFYQPDARHLLPSYLDEPIRRYLEARADAKGVELSVLVNEILKRDIDLVESLR